MGDVRPRRRSLDRPLAPCAHHLQNFCSHVRVRLSATITDGTPQSGASAMPRNLAIANRLFGQRVCQDGAGLDENRIRPAKMGQLARVTRPACFLAESAIVPDSHRFMREGQTFEQLDLTGVVQVVSRHAGKQREVAHLAAARRRLQLARRQSPDPFAQ
jgi:hypothetical protein